MPSVDLLPMIAAADLASIGLAPPAAIAMTYLSMADSLGLIIQNATAHQQRMQALGTAATAQVLVALVAAGGG